MIKVRSKIDRENTNKMKALLATLIKQGRIEGESVRRAEVFNISI